MRVSETFSSLRAASLVAVLLLSPVFAAVYAPPAAAGGWVRATRVVVYKSRRQLLLIDHGRVVKRFHISLGERPVGPKIHEGDMRTPVGHYRLDWKNADSRFYMSIHISYPNARDRARARRLGENPGDDIMIHGLPDHMRRPRSYYLHHDWTHGCIAVSDDAMQWIWMAVRRGTPIDIKP